MKRYLSLDAYRGFIMILLVSGGFGFSQLPPTTIYRMIAHQFEHEPWGGAVFYDLIMPAFLFMVGVAMPFSLGARMERGDTFSALAKHVAARSAKLLLISQILLSIQMDHFHLQFHNVLTQVAITYFLGFFLMQLRFRLQVLMAFLLLAAHSALYLFFPGADGPFQQTTNIGAVIDRFVMGENYPWPCVNINFIPETASVLFGIWAGKLMRSGKSLGSQLKLLSIGMVLCFVLGLLLSPWIPINKWLWTASYTLYTTGWSILGLLLFHLLAEGCGLKKMMFPLMVVGMNSIFVYSVDGLFRGWINHSLTLFTGGFKFLGTWAPVAQSCAVLMIIWYLAYWLYVRKIFLKV
jgi:predicted acyltransferase